MADMTLTWTTFADDQRHLIVKASNGTKEALCGFAGRSVAAHMPCTTCMDRLFRAHDSSVAVPS